MKWFDTLPKRMLSILLFNICLATFLALIFGIRLYKQLKILIGGIKNLKQEKSIHLIEKGIFRELAKNINVTSNSIENKNTLLKQRDNARSNWIAGISHDIRTPLSIIMGYSDSLSDDEALSAENKKKAEIITKQSLKIKKMVEDLNLISFLEYDMQLSKKKNIKICTLLRRVTSDILNSGISDKYDIELNLHNEKAFISGDETLIERALFNIINNSIIHNKNGCIIKITESMAESKENICIDITDNGKGVSDDVLKHTSEIPKTTHGLGLPMAYKIITVHGGRLIAKNNNGFCVHIILPVE